MHKYSVLTIFPEMFKSLSESGITSRVLSQNLAQLDFYNPRDYTDDNYHVSATYSRQKGWNSWKYYSTSDAASGTDDTDVTSDSFALRGWWRPEETGSQIPSVSVGYDTMSFDGRTDVSEASGYFIGLNWADMFQPDDKIGLAFGQPTTNESARINRTLGLLGISGGMARSMIRTKGCWPDCNNCNRA